MWRRLVLIVGLLALAVCREKAMDHSEWPRVAGGGLSIAVPPEYTTTGEDLVPILPGLDGASSGPAIALSTPHKMRRIDRIDIGFQETALRTGPMSTPVAVSSGSSPEPYKIYDTGGGSGGIEYVLKTSTMLGGRRIYITAEKQREYIPSFPEAWAVIDSIRIAD